MVAKTCFSPLSLAGLLLAAILLAPRTSSAHPLGNFSISHYAGIRVEQDVVELRYLIDMAEIPTFQEIQETGIAPEVGHPSLHGYLARKAEVLKDGLLLEVNGRRLRLQVESKEVIFPPGAGGLPTMKVGILSRAKLDDLAPGLNHLRYRDGNFPDRAGWKEIVAVGGPGIAFANSSAPEKDRSNQLADYPTDLLNSPPQDLEAHVLFTRQGSSSAIAAAGPPGTPRPPPPEARAGGAPNRPLVAGAPTAERASPTPSIGTRVAASPERVFGSGEAEAGATIAPEPIGLQANRQATARDPFTELVATRQLGFGIVLFALAMAAGLGAFHALEPGHGKTVVAAYLVGSRGTAWHAVFLGLVVTATHTAGVYLLGAVTLYASRYVVPERLYPWLGVISGLTIAGLGFFLFLQRYVQLHTHGHLHSHSHHHNHAHHSHGLQGERGYGHGAHGHHHHHHRPDAAVSLRDLLALGVTGGIVPCPAALVVLLSAVALRRVAFGLLLIVAFSVGLAAVLIAIGLLMVYARRFMSRFAGEGPLITRWLPLTSAAVITLFGVGLAVQALVSAGILQIRL